MNSWKGICLALMVSIGAASCRMGPVRQAPTYPRKGPKNIIIMISDGCGYKQIEATNLYEKGRPKDVQVYEHFPVKLAMATFSVGKGYDPTLAWHDFHYVKSGATDSAAAATAMSTGVKTYDTAIGVDVDRRPLKHLLERAEELGKATGVVTSVQLSHATPAGFVAHNPSRSDYEGIAIEMILTSKVDVIMGAGHPYYDNDGRVTGTPNYRYVGGEATWSAVLAGTGGLAVDADHNGLMDDAWTLVETRGDFQRLAIGRTPKRVLGVAQVYTTLQQARSGDRKAEPYTVPFISTVPTLREMTVAALNILDEDPDGFVLMVEGGAVDWAAHANQSGRLIEEQMDFNRAVEAVVDWVRHHSSWEETLLIVTCDHETGYLTAPNSDTESYVFPDVPLVANGAGRMPGMQWNSGAHTNSLVPIFVIGKGMDLFRDYVVGTDPIRGEYIDNTACAKVIFTLLDYAIASGTK